MDASRFDVIVIGTGPGGEGAAMQAVKSGRNVAAVERFAQIGGGCTHWGTIPSKSLRFSISQLTAINGSRMFRDAGVSAQLSFPELRRSAASVIEQQADMRRGFYDRNGVDVIPGHAVFVDAHTLEVRQDDRSARTLRADEFVIATGSRPWRPENVDFEHPRVFDSDTILRLDHTPRSITILGAGVVGCEYASMFRNLEVKVNLVNERDKLLEFLDDQIIDALSYHLRDRGVIIRHREKWDRVEARDDGVILHLKSGKQIKTNVFLAAIGRTGNTDELGLDRIGLEPNQRGQLDVNEHLQTALPHVYAVGDVIGYPSLASAAYMQGRYAAGHMIEGRGAGLRLETIPSGIYTSPEISSVGRTERELTEDGVPYEVGEANFRSLARAQITGRTVGMLKLLFHRETLQVLGIHCFGMNAAEIIHIGQAIMLQPGDGNSLHYFLNTTFNYPTMAEAYRVAALNGFNRLF